MATVDGRSSTMWALGDYHRFATATVWPLGPVLVERVRDSRGPAGARRRCRHRQRRDPRCAGRSARRRRQI